jgi:hypothetical protein
VTALKSITFGFVLALSSMIVNSAQEPQGVDGKKKKKSAESGRKRKDTPQAKTAAPPQSSVKAVKEGKPDNKIRTNKPVAQRTPKVRPVTISTPVFADLTSKVYHMNQKCPSAPAAATRMKLGDAQRNQLTPCSVCGRTN